MNCIEETKLFGERVLALVSVHLDAYLSFFFAHLEHKASISIIEVTVVYLPN